MLIDDRGRNRPVIVEIDFQRGAAAIGFDIVVVIFDQRAVVDREVGGRIAIIEGKRAGAGDIVDISASLVVKRRDAERSILADRQIDVTFGSTAEIALAEFVALQIDAARDGFGIGGVGDDAQHARQRARAEQRALRPGQRLYPGNIVNVEINCAADRGDWSFIDIERAGRQRTDVKPVTARRYAAEKDLRLPGAERLETDARQQLGIVVKRLDVGILELGCAERVDTDRHVLQAFRTALRSDDDFGAVILGRSGVLRESRQTERA